MSGRSATILIFGNEPESQRGSVGSFGSNRVPTETIGENLKTVLEGVNQMFQATRGNAGDLRVSHVDVRVAIAADGSVGLLGPGTDAGTDATFTVRLTKTIPPYSNL